jgi:hypothetical protein
MLLIVLILGMIACIKQEEVSTDGTKVTVTILPTEVPMAIPTVAAEPFEQPETEPSEEDSTGEGIIELDETSPHEEDTKYLEEDLCAVNEEVIISFPILDSRKRLAVCVEKNNQDYIVYRYGTKEQVELIYPEDSTDSFTKFVYSYYLRGGAADNEGLDLNYLSFENNGFRYKIYQEYAAASGETEVGILVTDIASGEETKIEGVAEEAEGDLIDLRDNDKIKIEN